MSPSVGAAVCVMEEVARGVRTGDTLKDVRARGGVTGSCAVSAAIAGTDPRLREDSGASFTWRTTLCSPFTYLLVRTILDAIDGDYQHRCAEHQMRAHLPGDVWSTGNSLRHDGAAQPAKRAYLRAHVWIPFPV